MGPKPILVKHERKSGLMIPSRIVSRPDNREGGEVTEIAAQISIPQDGGWGWVVVAAAFLGMLLLDGICFTFGSLINDMSRDLNTTDSLIALVNSIAVAIYFIAGPLASAFINRFGFRACVMSGSVLSSLSLFTSYYATNFTSLCVFYGLFAGFGYCLINMASGLVVGFYFEKLRSLAVAIATCGSSVGIMAFSPMNSYLVTLAGWRTTTLLHSGLIGLTYFCGMTFQPLLSFTVTKTTDDPTRTVTYLPTLSKPELRTANASTKDTDSLKPTTTEKLFSAVSNYNFPTVASVIDEGIVTSTSQPGPSTAAVSKLTLTANAPQGISQRQLKQVQSIISKSNLPDKTIKVIEITVSRERPKKSRCWGNLCNWQKHVPESRPMYRDDAFYDGKIQNLPVYQKSMINNNTQSKTGLEYQLAVTRAATAVDVKEQRGLFTTAARRILATMMDPKLLRRKSFLCLSSVGFLIYVGFMVPFVFIQNRNISAGLNAEQCTLFVSVIGFSNAIGRLVLGAIACKVDPLNVYKYSMILTGISTILSSLSYSLYYQYGYCFIFGFFGSSVTCLRSMVLVSLYGLDNLTNSTGIVLLFQGLGSLFSTPIAGLIKNTFGYTVAFCVAGIFMTVGGILLIPVRIMCNKENRITQEDANSEK